MNTLKNLSKIFDGSYNESCNLQDLCRLCGNIKMNMVSVFNKADEHDYSTIISIHFRDFHITECDILPTKLCVHCITSLMSWHKFYNNCMDVNNQLIRIQEKLEKLKSSIKEENTSNIKMENSIINTDIKLLNSIEECVHNQDNIEDISDIEVIEIKFDRDGSLRTNDVYSGSTYSEEVYDIANVQMHDDVPELQIVDNVIDKCDLNDGIKDKKLDIEEMAISEEDLCTSNDNCQPTPMKMETVEQPSRKIEKLNRLKKSTVCRVCGKLYVTRTSYLRHLLKQHSNHTLSKQNSNMYLVEKNVDKKLKVGITTWVKEEEVSSGERIEREEEENEEPRIMCDACGKTFRFQSSYRKHVRDHHSDEQPKVKPKRSRRMCDLCGKICSSGSFKGHMKKHTNPESVTCEHCGQVFSFVSVLKSHIKVRHSNERPFRCKLCESSFKRADYLRSHMRYKHEPKLLRNEDKSHPYRCEDCDSTFRNKESLEKHRTWKSENDTASRCPATFQCEVCDSTFKKRNYLVLHKRYVHDERRPFRISEASVGPYKCDKCERRFASVCGRNYHCKSAHGAIFDTKFSETCDHCGLTFRNRVFYAKHCAKLREKPTCYLCWNAFDNGDVLKEHMHEVHVDDLPFLCELCHNRFVTLRQLNDHIRSRHAKIRPFKCDYCHHTSVRKDSLEVHIRSCHLGQKPYKCDLCDKAFSQSSDLRKHRIIHTRNKLLNIKKEQ